MRRYLARKAGFYILTFVIAVTIDWAIPRFMPGDPIQSLISRMQAQPESQEALTGYYTKAFGMDVPLWKQYLNFWNGLLHGDLGTSIWQFPRPVSSLILHAVPYTLALLVPAIVLSFLAGNKVGALAARRKVLDTTVLPASEDIGREIALRLDRDTVRRAVAQLGEPAASVIRARFGLDGDPEPLSYSEIAKRLRMSRRTVRAIELRALEDLARLRELQGLSDAA